MPWNHWQPRPSVSYLNAAPERPPTDSVPGPTLRCAYWSDLGDELRLRAEQLGETLCQPLCVLVRIRVLDEPSIGAHRAALSHQLDQPLDTAPARAHALDGLELRFDHQDRLEVERRSEPCGGAADPAAAPQILKRVERNHCLTSWRARRAPAITPEPSSPAAAARAAANA